MMFKKQTDTALVDAAAAKPEPPAEQKLDYAQATAADVLHYCDIAAKHIEAVGAEMMTIAHSKLETSRLLANAIRERADEHAREVVDFLGRARIAAEAFTKAHTEFVAPVASTPVVPTPLVSEISEIPPANLPAETQKNN